MGNCVVGVAVVGPEVTPIFSDSGFGAGFSQGKLGGFVVVSETPTSGSLNMNQFDTPIKHSPTIWNHEIIEVRNESGKNEN